MFNPLESALLSSRSLYVCEEDLSVKAKRDHLFISGDDRCNSYLNFFVRLRDHFAAVQILIAPFGLHQHPDQIFYRCVAQTKACCPEAPIAECEDVLYVTAQRVYRSSFHRQSWNFASRACWKHRGTACASTAAEQSCHASVLRHVHDDILLSLSADDVQENVPARALTRDSLVADTTSKTTTTSWKKRTREALERARCELKRSRNSSLAAVCDNQTWQENVFGVANEAGQETTKTRALEHIKRLLQIEKQANQVSNYCQYLASCILLVYIKDEEQKRATEVFQSVGLHAKTAKRRIEEAKLASRIIASVPKSTVTTEFISMLFDDNMYAIVRAAVRSRKTGFDTVVADIVGSLSDSANNSGLTQPTFDLIGHIKAFFPDHDVADICTAISFDASPTSLHPSRAEGMKNDSASRSSSDRPTFCQATREDTARLQQEEDLNSRTSETTFEVYTATGQCLPLSGLEMTYTRETTPTHVLASFQAGTALTRIQNHGQHVYDTQAANGVSVDVYQQNHHLKEQGRTSSITPTPSMTLQDKNSQVARSVGLSLPALEPPLQSIPPDYITEWPPITDPFAYDDAMTWPSHVYLDGNSNW